jgi:hypothetical protein
MMVVLEKVFSSIVPGHELTHLTKHAYYKIEKAFQQNMPLTLFLRPATTEAAEYVQLQHSSHIQ